MTATPNLGLTLPVNGADSDAWGTELNTALTAIDSFFGGGVTAAFGTTGVAFVVNAMTQTDGTTAAGTVATAYAHPIKATTFATSSNAITITNAYGVYCATPVAGAHVTITGNWAIGADNMRLAGANLTPATASTYTFNINDELCAGYDGSNTYIQSFNTLPLVINGQGNPVYIGSTSSFLGVGTTTNGGWGGFANFEAKVASGSNHAAVSAYSAGTNTAFLGRVDSTSTNLATWDYSGTTQVGSISTNGTSTTYATSSDERLKENIADAADAGTIIDRLRVRSWDWKSSGAHESYGFVAQEEVLVYAPGVVQGDDDTTTITKQWSRDDSKLVPLLVKEIQSLRVRMAVQEAK